MSFDRDHYKQITERYVEAMFPPYAWDRVKHQLDLINKKIAREYHPDVMYYALRYDRKRYKHLQRFEYYTSRMPFPREWFMFDFSIYRRGAVYPYDFQLSFFDYYSRGGEFKHEYDPENFRSVVVEYNSPILMYTSGEVQSGFSQNLRTILSFINKLYDLVVNQGRYGYVENRYGYVDYEFIDWAIRVPNVRVRPGQLPVALLFTKFYYLPSRDHTAVQFTYAPAFSTFNPRLYSLFFERDFIDRSLNYPKTITPTYVHWFATPFFSISQPVYFDARGNYVMGWFLDELTYNPTPPAVLGKTLFIGTEFLRAFYHFYRFSRLVRYMSYYAGVDKYPYPFHKIDLVEEHPLAALSFMFFLAHRLAFVDSATYRAQGLMYWRSAKEVMVQLGYTEYFRPLNVFTGSQRWFSPKVSVLDHSGYEYFDKITSGVYLYPEVSGWFRPLD